MRRMREWGKRVGEQKRVEGEGVNKHREEEGVYVWSTLKWAIERERRERERNGESASAHLRQPSLLAGVSGMSLVTNIPLLSST